MKTSAILEKSANGKHRFRHKDTSLSNGKIKFPCSLIIFRPTPISSSTPPPVVRLTPKAFQLERPRVSLCWSNLKAIGQSVFE
jgi:hypothetical protein